MDDKQIIDLYWKRDESAIYETNQKYGGLCYGIAKNILTIHEDAEECVNDTYHQAWISIPPQRPEKFGSWLGKVVRNCAINLWNRNHRKKRYAGMTDLLSEMEDCIPSGQTVEQEIEEQEIEEQELTRYINEWLRSLKTADRKMFIQRYWYGEALSIIAERNGISPGKMAQQMYRLRRDLKCTLEKEGISL